MQKTGADATVSLEGKTSYTLPINRSLDDDTGRIWLGLVNEFGNGIEFSYEHAGTDLTFASSDGVWRGEEDMMKGRQFADVLVDFELYRLRAGQPEVKLLRTKPWKKPCQWAWWFDRRNAPKWQVRYVSPNEVPRATTKPPSIRDATPAERAQARLAAAAYLLTLR